MAPEMLRKASVLQNDHKTYRITWSEEDGEHVGLCIEFPNPSWLAPAPEAALQGIRQVIPNVFADLQANHEPVPEPLAAKKYSGWFVARTGWKAVAPFTPEPAQPPCVRFAATWYSGESSRSLLSAGGRFAGRRGGPAPGRGAVFCPAISGPAGRFPPISR